MFRVTSLANMPEQQLNRWIKRIALLFFVVLVVFVALYAADRFRMPAPAIADQRSATLEEAVRKDPADFAVRGQLADVYLAEARYPEAIAQYTAIIDAKKDLEAAYASRGRAYELSNQLDAAKADYTQVVGIARDGEMAKVDPTLELAYYGLGSIALQENKPQAAVDQLLLALAIQRTDADAMNLLGAAYLALDKPKDAVDPLRKAVEFVPVGWADPYVTLAKAYTKAGQADEATWASALAALATGDIATAEASLTNITNGDAKIDAYVGLGLVAETRSDSATAADWYRKALALDSTNQLASFGLGRTAAPATAAPSVAPSGAPSPSTSTEGLN